MTERDQIILFVQRISGGDFDPEQDELSSVLDSVSLLQLIVFIEQELGVSLDVSNLTLDDFVSVDSLMRTIQLYR